MVEATQSFDRASDFVIRFVGILYKHFKRQRKFMEPERWKASTEKGNTVIETFVLKTFILALKQVLALKKKLIKIIKIRKSYFIGIFLYFSMTIFIFFLHVSFFSVTDFFLQCQFFFSVTDFQFQLSVTVLASRGRGLRGGASRAWFAYHLRR